MINDTPDLSEAVETPDDAKKKSYPQNWPAYKAAQENEKDMFLGLLAKLVKGIPETTIKDRGRPPIPISDSVFGVVLMAYTTLWGRRFIPELQEAQKKGYLGELPSLDCIDKVLDSKEITTTLKHLISEAARPFAPHETHFSVDSSGFNTSEYDRWYDHKRGIKKTWKIWVKTHIMVAAGSNIVTAAAIYDKNTPKAVVFPLLLAETAALGFNVKEVAADKGYSSIENLTAAADIGAFPLIPFKINATEKKGGIWARALRYFVLHLEEFMRRYHLCFNSEMIFHKIKTEFGYSVRSETDTAMKNEVLAKILCHNICCVIEATYKLEIGAVDWGIKKKE